jgi:hypothetical protein
MDKRLQKRHKRAVARAREHVKVSEPDVRTPEEVKAAREASRPAAARHDGPQTSYSGSNVRHHAGTSGSAAKADA